MGQFKGVAAFATVVALTPLSAKATTYTWLNTVPSGNWNTTTNWSPTAPAGGPSGTGTKAQIIGGAANPEAVTVTANILSLTSGLVLGGGFGTADSLTINSGVSFTTSSTTLQGGTINGPGTFSGGTISGYGAISAPLSGTVNITANAADGTNFGGFSPFVNGTPGTPITLLNQSITGGTLSVSGHGDFNLSGTTLNGTTLNGVSSNLNAGAAGGNNYYGLLNVTGSSTLKNTINNTNYQQMNITNSTLSLSNFSLANTWATNVPAFFVVGPGGILDNTGGSTLNGHMSNILKGGSITNSSGGSFAVAGQITGYGTVSGPISVNGGLTASGGTLTVDGTQGTGISIGPTSWQTGGGASDVLDMKGTFTYPSTGGFLNPNGGTVQLDAASLNAGGHTIYGGTGTVNVASGINTLNGSFVQNGSNGKTPNFNILNGATLSLQNPASGVGSIYATNFNMANGSALTIGSTHGALTLTGNFSSQQTDTSAWSYNGMSGLGPDLIMNGGTSSSPTTLEAGGINEGYVPGGFINNFALDSLTIGANAYVDVVDQFDNATALNWTSGTEVLYLDSLFGALGGTYGTLNEDGIAVYLAGFGLLPNGTYTDTNGGRINVIGAPTITTGSAIPEPASLLLLGTCVLAIIGWHRLKLS